MTTYSLLTIFILIYPIILVTSEQRRLELGLLQQVTSTPIKLHNTIPINVDTRQMSELAYTSLSNLKGILSGANSFVSGERRSVKYRMKEVAGLALHGENCHQVQFRALCIFLS